MFAPYNMFRRCRDSGWPYTRANHSANFPIKGGVAYGKV